MVLLLLLLFINALFLPSPTFFFFSKFPSFFSSTSFNFFFHTDLCYSLFLPLYYFFLFTVLQFPFLSLISTYLFPFPLLLLIPCLSLPSLLPSRPLTFHTHPPFLTFLLSCSLSLHTLPSTYLSFHLLFVSTFPLFLYPVPFLTRLIFLFPFHSLPFLPPVFLLSLLASSCSFSLPEAVITSREL